MKLKFILEKTDTGYSAFEDEQAIYSTGGSISELKKNIGEAVDLYSTENDLNGSHHITYEIDLQQFFDYYKVINAKHLAHRIGMNESLLSQYVNGVKKPSREQVNRIVNGLREIGQELLDIEVI